MFEGAIDLVSFDQGIWMGVLTASGSFARFTGPIFVTSIYNEFGPYLTFALVVGSMVLSLITSLIFYKRLVPLKDDGDRPDADDNEVEIVSRVKTTGEKTTTL